ncbi:MAG: putative metal-dependent hydrolase [Crocinitomicaceae bacterium]|nr:putative metal-dependent hydrolase [Crocinitomicaceae bacterium]
MTNEELMQLKYPIGQFECQKIIDENTRFDWIKTIAQFPYEVRILTDDLSDNQKNWRYRPEGWKLKQVVHHCADSHLNSLTRFKLALTEEKPTIRPYYEDRWAELVDSQDNDLFNSIALLTGLHAKWSILLQHLSSEDLKREFVHPEHGKSFSIEETIGIYSWHCQHHLAHIRNAISSEGKWL